MKFKWIIALSALFIAGCAAYFSVSGIALLFSGATVGVAIMASSLEIGKLVAASYLHRKWNEINNFFRVYFTIAVLVLIFITSMGIFGFLSNAYQKTALRVDQVESKVELLEQRKSGFMQEIERYNERIDVLSDQRTSQETRYDSLTANEHWVNARRTYNLIESADTEIRNLNSQITANRDSVNKIESEIIQIRSDNMDLAREIGGFKFVAEAFDVPVETAAKWFIIMLIFVFDPLAVSLVIAFNSYFEETKVPDKFVKKEKNKDLGKVSNSAQNSPNEKKKETWFERVKRGIW